MFGFLKDKLKGIVSKFSKKIDEEAATIEEAPKEEPKEQPKEPRKELPREEPRPKAEEKKAEKKPEQKPEPKAAPKPEPKAEAKAEEKRPEPKIEERRPEPQPEPKPAPKEEPHKELQKEEPVLMKMSEKERHGFFDFLKKHPKKEEEPSPEKEEVIPKTQEPVEEKIPEPKPQAKPHVEEKRPEPKIEERRPEPKEEHKLKPDEKPVKAEEEVLISEPEKEEKRGIFSILKEKITKKELNEQQFEEMFWDLEMILLENNVAVEVIDKIKGDLKQSLVNKPLERNKLDEIIESTLKRTIKGLFEVESIDLIKRAKAKKPYIICFVGINGSGKTTSIAKVAHLLKKNNLSSVMAASDTFRAAAIQQLEEHADRLGIKLIKHDYGADSAAVAFDAISYAKAHNIDVVLIDTAGRLQSNTNLMDELKKVMRITKPDLVIFVGESITGNDCVEQAKTFDSQVGIDCIILSKADIDEKGGAAISISYVTRKPIIYLGTGQGYDDLTEFDPKLIIESLGLEG